MKLSWVHGVLVGAVGVLLLANLLLALHVPLPFVSNSGSSGITGNAVLPSEDANAIEITEIVNSKCIECSNLDELVAALEQQGFLVSSRAKVEFDSSDGRALISEYQFSRVPSMVVRASDSAMASLSALWVNVGEVREAEKTFVFSNPAPLFFDLTRNRSAGSVRVVVLKNSACVECNPSVSRSNIEDLGVVVSDFSELSLDSEAGRALVEKYAIRRIPAIVFSPDIQYYESFLASIEVLGSVEPDGSFVLRNHPPVFFDLDLNRSVGKTRMVLVEPDSCETCFDANRLSQLLAQTLGLYVETRETAGASSAEGRSLIAKYAIQKLPTVLVSGETSAYTGLASAWESLGTIASDQTLVFSRSDLLGPEAVFFDISQNKAVPNSSVPEVIQNE